MEKHMDTSLRQSVILQMLNSSSRTCVSLSVSQTQPNSCSSVKVGDALMSLQTKKLLCEVPLKGCHRQGLQHGVKPTLHHCTSLTDVGLEPK